VAGPPAGAAARSDGDALLSRAEAWALIGCQPLAQLSNQALLPSLGAMRDDLDLSYAELGWVVAAFGLARLVVDLPAGSLATRWPVPWAGGSPSSWVRSRPALGSWRS
jgi:MFS family permease